MGAASSPLSKSRYLTWSTPGPHSIAKCGPRARNSDKRKPSLTCGKALTGRDSFPHHSPLQRRGHWFEPSTAHPPNQQVDRCFRLTRGTRDLRIALGPRLVHNSRRNQPSIDDKRRHSNSASDQGAQGKVAGRALGVNNLAKVRVASSNLVARSNKSAGQRPFSGPDSRQEIGPVPVLSPLVPVAKCEVSVPLSHIGLGTCVPLCGPASAPGRHWLRHLCLTNSTLLTVTGVITCAQPSRGGRRATGGSVDG